MSPYLANRDRLHCDDYGEPPVFRRNQFCIRQATIRNRAQTNPWFSSVAIGSRVWYSNPMLQKKLGRRIAGLRTTRQLTQTELAKKVGCSVEFISLVERGVNAPSVAGLEKFAKALRVEVADLFTFERKKRSRKPRPAKRT